MGNSARYWLFTFRAAAFCAMTSALAYFPAANAQDDDTQTADAEGVVEEILVTGSYVRRSVDSLSPVQVFGRDEILAVPRSNIAEFFVATTINSGSFFFNDSISQERSSASNIDLRGLGPQSTLVLLNGRRNVSNSGRNREGNVVVDVNALTPVIMIERIEVLKDGAAALYGTDAVAGVVNFITRNRFEGMEISADYRITEAGSQDDFIFAGIWGVGNDRTHIVTAIDYQDRDPFSMQQRFPARIAEFGLRTPAGLPGTFQAVGPGGPLGVPVGPPRMDPDCGNPAIADIVGNEGSPGIPVAIPAPIPFAGLCFFNNASGRFVMAAEERLRALTVITHQLSDDIELTAEVGFSRTRTLRLGGTFQIGTSVSHPLPVVAADHPFNPFGAAMFLTGVRVLPNATPDPLHIDSDDWHVAFDVDWSLNQSWNLDGSFVYARNDAKSVLTDTVTSRVQAGLDGFGGPNCNPNSGMPGDAATGGNCFLFNPFASSIFAAPGDPGSNDPELTNWLLAQSTNDSESSLLTVGAVLSGKIFDMPSGPLGMALGFQYRDESIVNDFDPLANAGEFGFLTQSPDFDIDRDVFALFFEFVVPVFPGFEIQLAGRYEDYGAGLNTFDPKVAAMWQPLDGLTFRASWGTSFRAPGLIQSGGSITSAARVAGLNTVSGMIENFTPVQFIDNDPDLRPEESDAVSFGVSWEVLETLSFGIDYWHFDFSDVIVPPNPAAIVAGNPGDPRITRDANGRVIRLDLIFENAASLETSGIDFNTNFDWDAGNLGLLSFNGALTYITKYDVQSAVGAPVIDGAGRRNFLNFGAPTPEWRANFSVSWLLGGHSARVNTRVTGGIEDDFPSNIGLSEDKSYTEVDLIYNFAFDSGLLSGRTTFTFGVSNVFDATPPIIANDFVTTEVKLYNPRGRVFFLGFHQEL